MRKLTITTLALALLICGTSIGAFAGENANKIGVTAVTVAATSSTNPVPADEKAFAEKHSMAEYEKAKARGRGLSKGQKIGIGVAIVATVIVIAAVAINKADFNTF
jgi:hypothetical protein